MTRPLAPLALVLSLVLGLAFSSVARAEDEICRPDPTCLYDCGKRALASLQSCLERGDESPRGCLVRFHELRKACRMPPLVGQKGKSGLVLIATDAEGEANIDLCAFVAANVKVSGVNFRVPR